MRTWFITQALLALVACGGQEIYVEVEGGPDTTQSALFAITKTDLAPHVGADLDIMRADTIRMRGPADGKKLFAMTNLKSQAGLQEVIAFIETRGMLRP